MKEKKMLEYILFKGANCVFYRLKKKELKQHCQTVLITYVNWARSLKNFFIDKRCITLKLEAIWHCPSKRLAGSMILPL